MNTSNGSPVTIVVPACNEGLWVRRTVEAILDTSPHFPLELILIDDGSTDGSFDFLHSADFRKNGVLKPFKSANLGVGGARNFGAARASGDVLVFLDSHVIPQSGWLGEMLEILQDSSVGIAGLAVGNVEEPRAVGFTYTFVDENLSPGWSAKKSDSLYETPCVSGCCMGIRRGIFERIGEFDPGNVGYGVEEIELSLRTWYLGYRCVVSPLAQVAHYFKDNGDRNFGVSWEDYDANLLRCVLTYFSDSLVDTIIKAIGQRENFSRSWDRVVNNDEFWKRRERLRNRFSRDDRWYFEKFAEDFSQFKKRMEEIKHGNEADPMNKEKRVICSSCGATNIGRLDYCLMCKSSLSSASQSNQKFCTKCGNSLEPGKKFCTNCGTKITE